MMDVQVLHWGIALTPVLAMLGTLLWLDAFKLVRPQELAVLLALGGGAAAVTFLLSGMFVNHLAIGFSTFSEFAAPWLEEASKGVVVVALFWCNRIGLKVDAVISGFAIGAGFSVVENMIYLSSLPGYGAGTWLVRGFGTAMMHATTLAIVAASAQEFSESNSRGAAGRFKFKLLWFIPGYLAAVVLHMLFNSFADRPVTALIGAAVFGPLVLLGIMHFGIAEAERWLHRDYKLHAADLAILHAGGWPQRPGAERIQVLAARLGTAAVHRFWELYAFLVVTAERALFDEASGDVSIDDDAVRAALFDLRLVEQSLGRLGAAALREALPFSRNDAWELSELRSRLQ